jgi:hypothetical protein
MGYLIAPEARPKQTGAESALRKNRLTGEA